MRKIVNLIKLVVSYLLSNLARKPVIWGKPAFVSIEPTNHCNLRCPECPTGQLGLTRAIGHLKLDEFTHFIDQLSPDLANLTLYFQGEPYLNTDLFNLISHARSRNIYVWTSTNGHYFTEKNIRRTIQSGLNKLIISLDGTDQEAYEKYRIGGSFQKVIDGTSDFVRIRKEMKAKRPLLEIQFLVLKSNEHQLKEIKELGKSLGVDRTVLKTAQFYDFEHGNPLMPENERWSRYKRTSRKESQQLAVGSQQYIINNSLPNRCFRMWSGCVVTWDGKVVPCCFDKDADHCLGDLKSQSFNEIWKGEPYKLFRKQILENRKSIDICRNCGQIW
ncbi:radical SAM/SPASM domain-containing protein [Bacteroidota bacterium]